ncbi:prepilin-type N-terminal cleavage/methylation domain-containing protein [Candidatus Dojkabacteria bacterium]|nr:prepilin-type N-terminal cleavage/methylation domain-containing protein [Candidatus Dojkabacteria bacterium]
MSLDIIVIRSKKGFTLVELLVAMAIIAVLIGLAGYGVTLALRASRDAQRQETLDSWRIVITDYLATNNKYPDPSIVGIQNANPPFLAINGQNTGLEFDGHLKPISTQTSSSRTKYCYSKTTDGFVLAAQLENGKYYELGTTDSNSCANAKLFW